MAQCPQGHESAAADYCDTCGVPMGTPPADASSGGAPAPDRGVDVAAPGGSGTSGAADAGDGGGGQACPHCEAENLPEALFCEACGYDFTTGTLPRTESQNPFDLDAPTNDRSATDGADDGADDGGTDGGTGDTGTGDTGTGDTGTGDTGTGGSPDPGATSTPAGAEDTVTWVVEQWIDPDWYKLQDSPDPLPSAGLPEVIALRKQSLLIGRPSGSRNIAPDIDCDPDGGVSRRHAQLTTDGARWWVEDLDSSNGTFVADAASPLPEDPIAVGQKTEVRVGERIYVGGWTRLVIRRATEDEQQNL